MGTTHPLCFSALYRHLFADFLHHNRRGLFLIDGPTGSGKTSSLIQDHEGDSPSPLQALYDLASPPPIIFITHAKNIIAQMVNDLKAHHIPVAHIKARLECWKDAFTEQGLTYDTLLEALNEVKTFQCLSSSKPTIFEFKTPDRRKFMNMKAKIHLVLQDEDEQKPLSTFLGYLEKSLAIPFTMSVVEDETLRAQYDQSRNHYIERFPFLKAIFPALIPSHEPRPVLVMTTKKCLMGFFDGERFAELTTLKDSLIIIDEFDFQFDVFLDTIFNHGTRQLHDLLQFATHCLNLETKVSELVMKSPTYLDASEALKNQIDKGLHTWKVLLDNLRQAFQKAPSFVVNTPLVSLIPDKSILNRQLPLFAHDFVTELDKKPFYIKPVKGEDGVYILSETQDAESIALLPILRATHVFVHTLGRAFFAYYPHDPLEQEKNQLMESALLEAFKHMNDAQPSAYSLFLTDMARRGQKTVGIRQHTIAGLPVPSHPVYTDGVACTQVTVTEFLNTSSRAMFDYRNIQGSPELSMVYAAFSNMVLGLSATANIARDMNHFDVSWIYDNLLANHTHAQAWPFLNPEEDQWLTHIIQKLNQQKEAVRDSCVHFDIHETTQSSPLNRENPLVWIELLQSSLGCNFDAFFELDNPKTTYPVERVAKVLERLVSVAQNDLYFSHIGFVASFRHLQKLFHADVKLGFDITALDTTPSNPNPSQYKITFDGLKPIFLCFFNAAYQNQLHETLQANLSALAQQARQEEGKLFILTQYASASNGLNFVFDELEHQLASKTGLDAIHLFESPFKFVPDTEDQLQGWLFILNKLQAHGVIDGADFVNSRHALFRGHSAIVESLLRPTSDHAKKLLALIIQSIGRIERVFTKTPHVGIFLDSSLMQSIKPAIVELAALQPNFMSRLSPLNRRTMEFILGTRPHVTPLQHETEQSQAIVEWFDFKNPIVDIRSRSSNPALQKALAETWRALRQACLQENGGFSIDPKVREHPTLNQPLSSWAYLDPKTTYYYHKDRNALYNTPVPQSVRVQSLANYRAMMSVKCIRDYFKAHDYQATQLVHPALDQRIVSPALAEEALKALFEHQGFEIDVSLPNDLSAFECYDFRLKDTPCFVDAKLWSTHTQSQVDSAFVSFPKDENQFLAQNLSHLAAIEKAFREVPNPILAVVALWGQNTIRYLDKEGHVLDDAHRHDARLIVVGGALTQTPYHTHKDVTKPFIELCQRFSIHEVKDA